MICRSAPNELLPKRPENLLTRRRTIVLVASGISAIRRLPTCVECGMRGASSALSSPTTLYVLFLGFSGHRHSRTYSKTSHHSEPLEHTIVRRAVSLADPRQHGDIQPGPDRLSNRSNQTNRTMSSLILTYRPCSFDDVLCATSFK